MNSKQPPSVRPGDKAPGRGGKVPSFLRPSRPSILPGGRTQPITPSTSARQQPQHNVATRLTPSSSKSLVSMTKPLRTDLPPGGVGKGKVPVKPESSKTPTRKGTDYRLVARAEPRTRFNLMKFHGKTNVNPTKFTPPLKMRRRDRATIQQILRASVEQAEADQQAATEGGNAEPTSAGDEPMGEGVSSSGVEPTLTTATGRKPSGPGSKIDVSVIAPYGGATRNKQLLFKKRTKQIFLADEKALQLRDEEKCSYLLEDFDRKELWTSQLQNGQYNTAYVLFMLMEDGFRVVPVDRRYKFTSKLSYSTLSIEEAEEQLKLSEKDKKDISSRWLMKRRTRKGEEGTGEATGKSVIPSALSRVLTASEKFKDNVEDFGSLGPRTVEAEDFGDMFDDDVDSGTLPKKYRRQSRRGDGDELDFDEDFQDDEEGFGEYEPQDEEVKEATERAKQQVRNFINEEDDEDEFENAVQPEKDENTKELKNLMRNIEHNKAYESDPEENPYFSDDDIFEEVETSSQTDPTKLGPTPTSSTSTVDSNILPGSPSGSTAAAKKKDQGSTSASGVKKRKRPTTAATSDLKLSSSSPATPTPASLSRSASDIKATRAGISGSSSGHISPSSRPTSGPVPSTVPETKKARIHAPATEADLITEQEVVNCIRNNRFTTKDLIAFFKPKLKANPKNTERIKTFVRKVATTRNNILELKE
ncbi:transcription factor IIF subunit tfg1 [Dispira simplex]|nr:transcription factor IIF subunit tfg1 [Dispira simplex]